MTKTPKVLVAGNSGHITETEMIIGLRKAGYDITAAYRSDSPQIPILRASGVPTRELNLKKGMDIPGIVKIRKWLRRERFNILHALSNQATTNFLWASYGNSNKVIAYRGAIGHVSRMDPTCYLKWLNPRLDQIICVSNAVKTDLTENGVPPEKLRTIYKGHSTEWYDFKKKGDPDAQIRMLFGIPGDAVLIGMVANMRPVKGADVLLQAMEKMPAQIHAILIGDVRDPKLAGLATKPALRGRIHFTGYRADATHLIGGLTVNIAPSRGREGLTRTVIEGMAQGVPAVVSNAGGLPELVEDGSTGFVVPSDDPVTLANRIVEIVQNPTLRDSMGAAAKMRIQQHFNINTTIAETADCYTALLNRT